MTEHSIVIFYIYIDIDTTNIDIVVRNSRNKITQLMHHYPETMLVGESKLYWLNKKDTLRLQSLSETLSKGVQIIVVKFMQTDCPHVPTSVLKLRGQEENRKAAEHKCMS